MARYQLASSLVASSEASFHLVQEAFRRYLNRDADADGLAVGAQFLQIGGTHEQFVALLLGSSEYLDQVMNR